MTTHRVRYRPASSGCKARGALWKKRANASCKTSSASASQGTPRLATASRWFLQFSYTAAKSAPVSMLAPIECLSSPWPDCGPSSTYITDEPPVSCKSFFFAGERLPNDGQTVRASVLRLGTSTAAWHGHCRASSCQPAKHRGNVPCSCAMPLAHCWRSTAAPPDAPPYHAANRPHPGGRLAKRLSSRPFLRTWACRLAQTRNRNDSRKEQGRDAQMT